VARSGAAHRHDRVTRPDPVDAILFSANANIVVVDDAVRHLADHSELYWEVGFPVARKTMETLTFPILGYMHISGGQVEYRVTIKDILPFTNDHYENKSLARSVKPEAWILEWKRNAENVKPRVWKSTLVLTRIEPFSWNTYDFHKLDGTHITHPPQRYARVMDPSGGDIRAENGRSRYQGVPVPQRQDPKATLLAERNLEDFVIERLELIEVGLHLVSRQLSTPAGRLDLLCMDSAGNYVVVELKRDQGSDRVVGQILRYMGWVKVHHSAPSVRGIIIVGRKDPALSFAIEAAPNIQVREFHLSIR